MSELSRPFMQPIIKQFQQPDQQTYLKLSIDSLHLFKHLLFHSEGRGVDNQVKMIDNYYDKRVEDIEIIVYMQYNEGASNTSLSSLVHRLQGIRLSNVISRKTQQIVFQPLSRLWDCFCILPVVANNAKSGLLTLSYQIRATLQSSYQNRVLGVGMMGQKRQQERRKVESEGDGGMNVKRKEGRKRVGLPYKSEPITFPLQRILRSPYVINQLTISVSLNSPNNPSSLFYSTNQPQSQNHSQQSSQRDGIFNLTLVYLPNIRPSIKIKNLIITTKPFVKIFGVVVEEIERKMSVVVGEQMNKTVREQGLFPRLVIPVEIGNWQKFENRQSFIDPITMSLTLNSNFDELDFSIAYEMEKKSTIIQQPIKQVTQKLGNKKNKNVINNKATEWQSNKQMDSRKQAKQRKQVKIKRILIQKLSQQRLPNQEWTRQCYRWQNNQQQFQLQFLFNLSLNRPLNEQQQYPLQQENSKTTQTFQQLKTVSKLNQ